ncbi:class F sortase [Streptomyces sp. HK10]|uniref:class F sortase n=1 Tax=Streptomyces sp. HK10 TaxID=3373255 RepID=UPI0037478607
MRASIRGGRPSAAAVTAAAVVAAVLAALLAWSLLRPSGAVVPQDFGDRPRAQEPAAGSPFEVHDSEAEGADGAGNASAPAPEPVALSIPRLSLEARVQGVGVGEDGTVEIPGNAGQAGWYRYGPAPGAPAGSAVVVGHVDDRTGDLGAFAKLYGVREGDDITVEREDAPPLRYEVTAREVVDQDSLPDEVFRRDGRPVLTLVTCAPPFDREGGGYQKNLLVYAVPAGE